MTARHIDAESVLSGPQMPSTYAIFVSFSRHQAYTYDSPSWQDVHVRSQEPTNVAGRSTKRQDLRRDSCLSGACGSSCGSARGSDAGYAVAERRQNIRVAGDGVEILHQNHIQPLRSVGHLGRVQVHAGGSASRSHAQTIHSHCNKSVGTLPTQKSRRRRPQPAYREGEALHSGVTGNPVQKDISSRVDAPGDVTGRVDHSVSRRKLLYILATTQSAPDAWHAYEILLSRPRRAISFIYSMEHLHRLTRLISTSKPQTRLLFTRLLSVMSTIHETGGRVQLWQWNALMNFAGRGWRRTKQEDFKNALDIYNDMMSCRSPGATLTQLDSNVVRGHDNLPSTERPTPDIVTVSTLFNIAAHTFHTPTIHRAESIHKFSNIPPNRITLLTYLRYFTSKGDFSGIRQVILRMAEYQFDVGVDGINAYIWAYGRNGRLDIASAIYSILRTRISEKGLDPSDDSVKYLQDEEGITVPEDIVPDKITYTLLLQAYSHHGYLTRCLQVFMDYINAVRNSQDDEQHLTLTRQMLPIYRAIFLGFSRHGAPRPGSHLQRSRRKECAEPSAWSLEPLEALFFDFLAIPADIKPTPRLIWWILVAFARTTDNNAEKLREVYSQMRERFPGHWGGRLMRLEQKLFTP